MASMNVTFVGVAFTRDGHVHGRSLALSADELRDSHPPVIALNLAHDKDWPLGELVSLYRVRSSGDVWAVACADVPPWLLDGPCYFSPEWTARPDGNDIELTGMAICTAPATVGLRSKGPLTVFDGDVGDAGQWLIDGKRPAGLVADVIRDSRQEWRRRHSRSVIRVGGHRYDDGPWIEGQPLRRRDERPTGKLRRSHTPGHILRVS
jgi:hypothetical protein